MPLKDEEAIAFVAGNFLQDAELDEVIDQGGGGIGLRLDELRHRLDADHRILIERPHERLRIGLPAHVKRRHALALDPFLERQDVLEDLDGQGGRLAQAQQKEPHPQGSNLCVVRTAIKWS